MEKPIIACDVSKGKSHIQGFIGLSNPISEPFEVNHLKSELKKLKGLARSLESISKMKPCFVFEFTGIYHESIVSYARSIGLDLYAISPLESAKVRKSKIRTTKTDSKDCLNIATVFYTRKIRKFTTDLSDIKALSRYKRSLNEQLISLKCIFRRYVDLIWPCFDIYFDVNTKFAQLVIGSYKHPNNIKKRTHSQLCAHISNHYGVSKNRLDEMVVKLKDYSLNCVSGVDENSAYIDSLIRTLNEIKSIQAKMEEKNAIIDEIPAEDMEKRNIPTGYGYSDKPREKRDYISYGTHHEKPQPKKTFTPPSAPKPQSAPAPDFKVGDSVQHKAFGKGEIIKMTPMGNDFLIEISFEGGVSKKLMLRAAALHMEKI